MLHIGTSVDLPKLLESRLLIQASSGAGKSYMLRVIAEQVFPHMPVVILDWEGEFASLRERFDVVLAGPGGEVPCDVKSAAMLARSLIELRVSAVVDLSELNPRQRQEYVRDFLNAMVGIPKKLWPSKDGKAVLVIVDEAHKLCPQKERSVASQAVTDLQSLGRKRGLCGVLATQRLSKLNKDAAAECSNVIIGRCSNIDAAKACDELGLPPSQRHELMRLAVGEWKAVGPAFKPGLQEFRGAKAKTSHAKSGAKLLTPPAPSAKIKKMVPALQAVQEMTKQEIADLAEANKEIANLRRKATLAEKSKPKPEADEQAIARAEASAVASRDREWQKTVRSLQKRIENMEARLQRIKKSVDREVNEGVDNDLVAAPVAQPHPSAVKVSRPVRAPLPTTSPNGTVSAPEQSVLDSVAWWNQIGMGTPSKACVAIMSKRSAKSGGFNNLLSQLRTGGYIDYPTPGCVELTAAGVGAAVAPAAHGTLEELHDAWRSVLENPQVKVMNAVIEAHPNGITKEELGEATDYSPTSGGFNNILSRLRKLGVITKGTIHATDLLFPDGLD